MPLLDALHDELDKLSIQLSRGYKHIVLNKDGTRIVDIGGAPIQIDNIDDLLNKLVAGGVN